MSRHQAVRDVEANPQTLNPQPYLEVHGKSTGGYYVVISLQIWGFILAVTLITDNPTKSPIDPL